MTTTTPKKLLLVSDYRYGESRAFPSMAEFKKAMLDCGWSSEDFNASLEDEDEPVEAYEAELVHPLEDGGLYVYEFPRSLGYGEFETLYVYYRVWGDGAVRYAGTFERAASEEEIAKLLLEN